MRYLRTLDGYAVYLWGIETKKLQYMQIWDVCMQSTYEELKLDIVYLPILLPA